MNLSHTRSRRLRRVSRSGFTLAEVMIELAIVATAAGLAIPSWTHSTRVQRGLTCGANLRIIQAAKQAALADDPNVTLNATVLQNYLPNGIVPACPSGGSYSGMFTPGTLVSCSMNGNTAVDSATGSTDITKNGQHDPFTVGGQQNLPTVVVGTPIKNPIHTGPVIIVDPITDPINVDQ